MKLKLRCCVKYFDIWNSRMGQDSLQDAIIWFLYPLIKKRCPKEFLEVLLYSQRTKGPDIFYFWKRAHNFGGFLQIRLLLFEILKAPLSLFQYLSKVTVFQLRFACKFIQQFDLSKLQLQNTLKTLFLKAHAKFSDNVPIIYQTTNWI